MVTKIQGKEKNKFNILKTAPAMRMSQAKPIKIFNNACPDIILANKRILKLKTFAK